MAKQLGYACINMNLSKEGISCNRSMIRRTFDAKGVAYASELIKENIKNLLKIVQWNNENGIKVYRMSSDMMPWMSEYELIDLPDYQEISALLKAVGKLAMDNGQRLSFHPGQFCVLSSETEDIRRGSIEEFEYHVDMARWMGYGKSWHDGCKINVHISGKNGPDGLLKVFPRLSKEAQNLITIENDETCSSCFIFTTNEYLKGFLLGRIDNYIVVVRIAVHDIQSVMTQNN